MHFKVAVRTGEGNTAVMRSSVHVLWLQDELGSNSGVALCN